MVARNEATPYTPTWKLSHSARNKFDQKYISDVIMKQLGRPKFSIPRDRTKDSVLELWRQQDREIVGEEGVMAADYKETQETYEDAGEDPDAVLPPLRPVRAPRPRKRPAHWPKLGSDSGAPASVAGKKRSRAVADEAQEDDQQPDGPEDGIPANESATSTPGELNGDETRPAQAERTTLPDSGVHPATNREKKKMKDSWPVNYTLPDKLPIVNEMKDDFRNRWNVKFTRVSRTEDITPLWTRLYQTYGYEARDLNLDYTDGTYQGPKDKSYLPITPEEQAKDEYRKRPLPASIGPHKRRKRNDGKVAKPAQTSRAASMAADAVGDVEMGGMDSDRGQVISENAGDMANPSDMLKARLASTSGAPSVRLTLRTELDRPMSHGSRKRLLIFKVKIQGHDRDIMQEAGVSQRKTGTQESGHTGTLEATSGYPVVPDANDGIESTPAIGVANPKPQAPSKRQKFAGTNSTGTKRTTRATSKLSETSQDIVMSGMDEPLSLNSDEPLDVASRRKPPRRAKTALPSINEEDEHADLPESDAPMTNRLAGAKAPRKRRLRRTKDGVAPSGLHSDVVPTNDVQAASTASHEHSTTDSRIGVAAKESKQNNVSAGGNDEEEEEEGQEDEEHEEEEEGSQIGLERIEIGGSRAFQRQKRTSGGGTHQIIHFPTRPRHDGAATARFCNGRELRAMAEREIQRAHEEAEAEGREYIEPEWIKHEMPIDEDDWNPWEGEDEF